MKKLATITLLSVIFAICILCSCSMENAPSPDQTGTSQSSALHTNEAETFLEENSDADLLQIARDFNLVRYNESGFDGGNIVSANDISQTGMYIYFTNTADVEDYWDSQDSSYHFPIGDIQQYIDTHFDGFTFKPEELIYPIYNENADECIATALPSPDTGFPELSDVKAVNEDEVEIKVNYYDRYVNSNATDVLYSYKIMLKIYDKGYIYIFNR